MKLKVNAKKFLEVISLAEKFGEELWLHSQETLLLNSGNLGGGYFFVGQLKAPFIEDYVLSNKKYGLSIETLKKVVKSFSDNISIEDEDNRLKVFDDKKRFYVDIFNIDEEEIKTMEKLPKMKEFSLYSKEWKSLINELNIFGYSVKFNLNGDVFNVKSFDEQGREKYSRDIEIMCFGEAKSTYNIKLLTKYVSNISSKFKMSFDTNLPFKIEYEKEGLLIKLILAQMQVNE